MCGHWQRRGAGAAGSGAAAGGAASGGPAPPAAPSRLRRRSAPPPERGSVLPAPLFPPLAAHPEDMLIFWAVKGILEFRHFGIWCIMNRFETKTPAVTSQFTNLWTQCRRCGRGSIRTVRLWRSCRAPSRTCRRNSPACSAAPTMPPTTPAAMCACHHTDNTHIYIVVYASCAHMQPHRTRCRTPLNPMISSMSGVGSC